MTNMENTIYDYVESKLIERGVDDDMLQRLTDWYCAYIEYELFYSDEMFDNALEDIEMSEEC